MDGETWEEVDPPSRTPEIAALVREFLRDYPPGEREAIQKVHREKSRIARRLREYRIDPRRIEDGTLVPFGEILYDRSSGNAIGASFLDGFKHEGQQYLVDDLYCPIPECRCEQVKLAFVRCVPRGEAADELIAKEHFLARLTLDGRAEVVECRPGMAEKAEAVLSAWQDRYGDDLTRLRWRYKKVKAIARRTAAGRTKVSRRCDVPASRTVAARPPHGEE